MFNELLGKGWVRRASFGWLPSSYLRVPPLFYRGVVPVIDHDHGNPPGLEKHSGKAALMPHIGVGQYPKGWVDGRMRQLNCTSIYDEPEMPQWEKDLKALKAKTHVTCAAAPAPAPCPMGMAADTGDRRSRCKSNSDVVTEDWCDGTCNADVKDPGCTQFCDCVQDQSSDTPEESP